MLIENRKTWIAFLSAIVVLILTFAFCIAFTAPAEDATILYVYSKNLASHGVIAYHPQLPPAEGGTDFLWMALLAGFSLIGLDPFLTSLLLSALATFGLLYLWMACASEELKKSVALPLLCLAVLLGTPFFYATLRGFTPVAFTALLIYSLFMFSKGKDFHAALIAVVATLLRPDAVVYLVLPALFILLKRKDLKHLCQVALVFALPLGLYWAWRSTYFGLFFPLPFYVKSGVDRVFGLFSKDSLHDVVLVAAAAVPLLAAGFVHRVLPRTKTDSEAEHPAESVEWRRDLTVLALIAAAGSLFFYAMMKNWMNVGMRFEAPAYFLLFLVAILHCRRIAYLAAAALVSFILLRNPTLSTMQEVALSEAEAPTAIAKGLRDMGEGRILLTEAGRLTYYSNWVAYDAWGLNTPEFATKALKPEDVGRLKPDLIVVHHGDYNYECIDDNEIATNLPGEKGTTFKVVWQAVRDEKPDLWFMSNQWEASKCKSLVCDLVRKKVSKDPDLGTVDYAVYVVPSGSQFRAQINDLLKANGALTWPEYKTLMASRREKG